MLVEPADQLVLILVEPAIRAILVETIVVEHAFRLESVVQLVLLLVEPAIQLVLLVVERAMHAILLEAIFVEHAFRLESAIVVQPPPAFAPDSRPSFAAGGPPAPAKSFCHHRCHSFTRTAKAKKHMCLYYQIVSEGGEGTNSAEFVFIVQWIPEQVVTLTMARHSNA